MIFACPASVERAGISKTCRLIRKAFSPFCRVQHDDENLHKCCAIVLFDSSVATLLDVLGDPPKHKSRAIRFG